MGTNLSDLAEAVKLGDYLKEARVFLASMDAKEQQSADITIHTSKDDWALRRGLTIEVPALVASSLLRAYIEKLTAALTSLGVNVNEAE